MSKTIWMYWHDGFSNAPQITQECLKSWKKWNPDYDIIELNDNNLKDYISEDIAMPRSLAARSDIIRINLLREHGGYWSDATVLCNRPIDEWIGTYSQNGFWAFSTPTPNNLICSWFLYGDKDSYTVNTFCDAVNEYWTDGRERPDVYLWFHGIFDQLFYKDSYIHDTWSRTRHYAANWQPIATDGTNPHYFAPYQPDRLKQLPFKNMTAPMYKLTRGASDMLMNNHLIQRLIK